MNEYNNFVYAMAMLSLLNNKYDNKNDIFED